jgi:hypothetical protein
MKLFASAMMKEGWEVVETKFLWTYQLMKLFPRRCDKGKWGGVSTGRRYFVRLEKILYFSILKGVYGELRGVSVMTGLEPLPVLMT